MDDESTITRLEALQTELRAYEAERAKVALEPPSFYRDARLKAWQWSIGVKRGQIQRERDAQTLQS